MNDFWFPLACGAVLLKAWQRRHQWADRLLGPDHSHDDDVLPFRPHRQSMSQPCHLRLVASRPFDQDAS